jgi:hypothetical protein
MSDKREREREREREKRWITMKNEKRRNVCF